MTLSGHFPIEQKVKEDLLVVNSVDKFFLTVAHVRIRLIFLRSRTCQSLILELELLLLKVDRPVGRVIERIIKTI